MNLSLSNKPFKYDLINEMQYRIWDILFKLCNNMYSGKPNTPCYFLFVLSNERIVRHITAYTNITKTLQEIKMLRQDLSYLFLIFIFLSILEWSEIERMHHQLLSQEGQLFFHQTMSTVPHPRDEERVVNGEIPCPPLLLLTAHPSQRSRSEQGL